MYHAAKNPRENPGRLVTGGEYRRGAWRSATGLVADQKMLSAELMDAVIVRANTAS